MLNSGLILDVYDDINGGVLRTVYPAHSDLPQRVKTAGYLPSLSPERLPDDVFALVVDDQGHKLRKFACIDAGNTTLSVQYFLKTAGKLPRQVQEKVASNLAIACDWYGLEEEVSLLKEAGLLGTVMTGMQIKGTVGELGARSAASKALGGGIHTPAEIGKMMGKQAELNATSDMPLSPAVSGKIAPTKAVIAKSASATALETNLKMKEEKQHMPPRLLQEKVMKPHVFAEDVNDYCVSAATPGGTETDHKQASFALGGKYPLDSYAQIKMASLFFEEQGRKFTPEDRHIFCKNLVKRANAIGFEVSDTARKYGSETYAPAEEIKMAFASRRDLLLESTHLSRVLDALEKQAGKIDPEIFCLALTEFDKTAGINHGYDTHVLDPYYSTFGFEKKAEFQEMIGNERITEKDLDYLAAHGAQFVSAQFTEELAEAFRKDPVTIYKSLPMEQKKLFMRMAAEIRADGY